MTNSPLQDDPSLCQNKESTIFCISDNEAKIRLAFEQPDPPHQKFLQIEYPFCDASKVNCDILLVPSKGNFLIDFNNDTGLHVGVVSSNGKILEYDKNGLRLSESSESRWKQCLRLKFLDNFKDETDPRHLLSEWENSFKLFADSKDIRWTRASYHHESNNCFDFALAFVKYLLHSTKIFGKTPSSRISALMKDLDDKISFCQQFIVSRTRLAARYISLHRKLIVGIEYIDGVEISSHPT